MIPVNEPNLTGREKELLLECIETGWISSDGPFIKQFEDGFAGYIGASHGIAVCNGTAALETALYAAGVGEGDEVIMPSFTIISCAIAAIRVGAVPVFVDVDPDTWCIDVQQIEERISPRTRCLMVVHMYGHPVDMDPVMDIAGKHGLVVLEDAAEVHGAEYKGKKCGSIGHIAAFSFYANKIITTGEGGMVVTSDSGMADRARLYRNLCFEPGRRYYHNDLGNNYRMTNLQAAVGMAQLERIAEFVETKRRLGAKYVASLSMLPSVQTQIEKEWAKTVYWMYCMVLDQSLGINAEFLMTALNKRGIGTRPFFIGLHRQPALLKRNIRSPQGAYPVTDRISEQGLYLPSGLTLTDMQVEEVVRTVESCLRECTR
jgi:perosamine synthetase